MNIRIMTLRLATALVPMSTAAGDGSPTSLFDNPDGPQTKDDFISAPETQETRFGTLEFDGGGFPTPETAQLLYDEMDLQRATQAFMDFFPHVSLYTIVRSQARDLGFETASDIGVTADFMTTNQPYLTGAEIPTDRHYDGVDQSAFLLGEQETSNRESLITWINNEVGAIRWRNYRVYPKAFTSSFYNNPAQSGATGIQLSKNELPDIYDIEMDPREQLNLTADHAWVLGYTSQILAEYYATLEDEPNPPGVSLTTLP